MLGEIYNDSNSAVKGVGYTIEPTCYQHYLLAFLNKTGFMDADGQAPPASPPAALG